MNIPYTQRPISSERIKVTTSKQDTVITATVTRSNRKILTFEVPADKGWNILVINRYAQYLVNTTGI